jgi:hypothetical protein
MNATVRNILAVIIGIVLGMVVNGSIVAVSGSLIPPPNGADVTTVEGLKATIHLFEPKHFLMPFLAHALGTFAGASFAALIAANRKTFFAMVVGVFFLFGGIAAVSMLPAPFWFSAADLILAYLPTAYLAGKLFGSKE